MTRTLVPLPVVVPMMVAALVAAIGHRFPRWLCSVLFTLCAAFNVWCTAMLLVATLHQPLVYWFGNWFPRGTVALGECFVIAPFPAALALLASGLTFFASIMAWQLKPSGTHLEALMLMFMAAMCGFVYSGDLFNLFVWFELMSAAAFALCGLKTGEPAPLQGAFNFGLTNSVGAFFIVTGLALLYARTGALNMAQIGHALGAHADALVLTSFLFMMIGYLVKGAIVPFHLWLADAHAVAPSPVCVLFSGIMVELGIYAVARIYWAMFAATLTAHVDHLRAILVVAGTITVMIGGAMCYAQHHLKRLLAYSTICHAGLMLIAVGLFDAHACGGFLLYVLGHGLLKGGLFAASGIVLHRLQYTGEPRLHGRGRGLVWTPLLFVVGAVGLAAAPGFLLEAAEAAVTHAGESTGYGWIRWVFFYGGIATAAAVLRFTFRTFFGFGEPAPADEPSQVDEKQETVQEPRKVPAPYFVPAALMIALSLALAGLPHGKNWADSAGKLFVDQNAYRSLVLDGSASNLPPYTPAPPEKQSLERGAMAAAMAIAIALATVFRQRLPFGSIFGHAERGIPLLHAWQSGHPGDYVSWISFGAAALGGCFVWLLR